MEEKQQISSQLSYYHKNKEKMDKQRRINYLKKKGYDFLQIEDMDFWKNHKRLVKAVLKEGDFDKDKFFELVNKIFEKSDL